MGPNQLSIRALAHAPTMFTVLTGILPLV